MLLLFYFAVFHVWNIFKITDISVQTHFLNFKLFFCEIEISQGLKL